ncbi:hypothetical protein D3C76_1795800 [compost metagenome]
MGGDLDPLSCTQSRGVLVRFLRCQVVDMFVDQASRIKKKGMLVVIQKQQSTNGHSHLLQQARSRQLAQ